MLCKEIMKTEIECVSPQTSVRDAARKMRDQGIGFLPVCDEAMKAIGTITDRDITVRAVAEDKPLTTSVESFLTREVIACHPDEDVSRARELMEDHQKSRIMCIGESGRIEGIISLSDIVDIDEQGGARTLLRVSQRETRGDSARQSIM